jgi:tetratricopeptide (TPR) repeat protein
VAVSAVAGMGGVGKTELAIRYARQHEADYPGGICWLNARDSNLGAEIVLFAQSRMSLEVPQKLGERLLDLKQQVEWCWQNWYTPPAPLSKGGVRGGEGLVLVVLDDVTDLGSCREVLPTANRFRVLMTTRRRRLDTNFVELPLDVLSPDAALELLTALVGERRVGLTSPPAPLRRGEGSKSKSNSLSPPFPGREGGQGGLGSSDALQLCEWLGYLPLGLELVGRYLAEDPDLSLAQMLERLKATPGLQDEAIDPDEEQLQDTEMTAKRGVRAAFELSWQELEPVTQHIAQYLSLFAPTVFVWEWVESETELLNCAKSDINAAKKQLYKRHLIERVEEREGGYKIHPLIREFLQAKLAASEQADEFRQAFAAVFVKCARRLSPLSSREFIESVKDCIPHLEEVAQNLTTAVSNEDLLWLFIGVGMFYHIQGLYALAEPWYQQCLSTALAHIGDAHPNVARILNNLAKLYKDQRRYSEAEPLYKQALALSQRLLGNDNLDVAANLNNLAGLYKDQGHYSKAEPLYKQALALRKRLLGDDHPDVAASLDNLAGLYQAQGHYSEAEPLHEQALALYKRSLREDHPDVALSDVAVSLDNLARLYTAQERYSEAEPLYEQAVALSKRWQGNDHPDVATSLNNLAGLYKAQGRYSEAESLYKQALAVYKRSLEDDHPYVATSLNNLAEFYRTQRRCSEAEPLYKQALALRKHRLRDNHPDVAISLNNLALLYYAQGQYSKAEPLFVQALELGEQELGVNHPSTITFRKNLALFRQERSSHNSKLEKRGLFAPFNLVKRFTQFLKRATKNLD